MYYLFLHTLLLLFLFIIIFPFWLGFPVFFWGRILGALTLRLGNLAVKDESKRLRSASWRTSLCDIKTNQTVTVGSCLDVGAVGTCLSGLFVCCDGLWGGKPTHSIGLGIQSSWRTSHTKAQCDGVITVTAQSWGMCQLCNWRLRMVAMSCSPQVTMPWNHSPKPLNNMFTNQNCEDRL